MWFKKKKQEQEQWTCEQEKHYLELIKKLRKDVMFWRELCDGNAKAFALSELENKQFKSDIKTMREMLEEKTQRIIELKQELEKERLSK